MHMTRVIVGKDSIVRGKHRIQRRIAYSHIRISRTNVPGPNLIECPRKQSVALLREPEIPHRRGLAQYMLHCCSGRVPDCDHSTVITGRKQFTLWRNRHYGGSRRELTEAPPSVRRNHFYAAIEMGESDPTRMIQSDDKLRIRSWQRDVSSVLEVPEIYACFISAYYDRLPVRSELHGIPHRTASS